MILTAADIALLTNTVLDGLALLRKIAPEAITPDNIEAKIAQRQAQIDALDAEINKE